MEYCNEHGKVPTAKETYQDQNIGEFYHGLKKRQIKDKQCEMYIKLCNGHPCIKENLDRYLSDKEEKKGKVKLNQDELLALFLEFCNKKERVPLEKETYQEQTIGNWYKAQKRGNNRYPM